MRTFLTKTDSSVRNRVMDILCARNPFEVFYPVVSFVAVLVVYLGQIVWIRNEGLSYNSVDHFGPVFMVQIEGVKGDITSQGMQSDHSWNRLLSPRSNRANQSIFASFVSCFKSGYLSPVHTLLEHRLSGVSTF